MLRPGGALLFIEHGKAPDDEPKIQRLQERMTPLWQRVAGNCHLDRRVDQLLKAAGLKATRLDSGYLFDGPKFISFHYRGRAILDTA